MGSWKKLKISEEDDIALFVETQLRIRTTGLCSNQDYKNQVVIPLIEQTKKEGEAWIYTEGDFTAVWGVKTVTYKDKYVILCSMTYPITLASFPAALEIIAIKILEHMQVQQLTHIIASTEILDFYETSIYYDIGIETAEDFIAFVHNTWQTMDLNPPHKDKQLTYIYNDSEPKDVFFDIYLQESEEKKVKIK